MRNFPTFDSSTGVVEHVMGVLRWWAFMAALGWWTAGVLFANLFEMGARGIGAAGFIGSFLALITVVVRGGRRGWF